MFTSLQRQDIIFGLGELAIWIYEAKEHVNYKLGIATSHQPEALPTHLGQKRLIGSCLSRSVIKMIELTGSTNCYFS